MTCNRWLCAVALLLACGGDDGGDDTGNDTANDDETPASDDFAPQDADASLSNSAGETAADDDGGTTAADADGSSGAADATGAGGCVEAGQACGPNDYCNTWICTCNAGRSEFMTVGSCEAGVCTLDGMVACEPICASSGGVASAVDGGCG
jgi:hypothetical protein